MKLLVHIKAAAAADNNDDDAVSVLAAACIRNLRQTFKYGGRQTLPSKVEVIAATVS